MINERYIRRLLKIAHTRIEDITGKSVSVFFEGKDYVYYDDITGKLMEELAMTEDQIDYLMGSLYVNVARSSDEYENLPTIKTPEKHKHKLVVEELWTVRHNRNLEVEAYSPVMSGFMAWNDPGEYEVSNDEEFINHEDTEMFYIGIVL